MLRINIHILVLVVLALGFICSCGQTGDLYLPEDEPKQKSKEKSET